jgi:hypothetical protein
MLRRERDCEVEGIGDEDRTVPGHAPLITPVITPITDAEFAATGNLEDARLRVRLRGHADVGARTALVGFVAQLDQQAIAAAVSEVVVDMRELEFMNSSCFRTLVTWLDSVRQRPFGEQYLIRFLHNPSADWQERSLGALSTFAPGLITVE